VGECAAPEKFFEILNPEMPGNTSNFNDYPEVAYDFSLILVLLMQTYVFNRCNLSPFPCKYYMSYSKEQYSIV